MTESGSYIRWFDTLGIADVPLVGGKNASLGEMQCALRARGVRVPDGFAVTADAYRAVLDAHDSWSQLHGVLDDLDVEDLGLLARRSEQARRIVYDAGLPKPLETQLREAWGRLRERAGEAASGEFRVAVRSSATAEDLPGASFAGQHESYLGIGSIQELFDVTRRCFASLFTERAIHYRADMGFGHFDVALSVGVMRMVRSDLATSGVAFTLDTESGFRDVVFLTAAYGLGENIVQGAVEPDEFYVHKPTYAAGHRTVLRHRRGDKAMRMVLQGGLPANEPTPEPDRERYCLSDEDVLELAGTAMVIEQHYGCAMDVEWAKDGRDGLLYVVQARPETAAVRRGDATVIEDCVLDETGRVLAEGRAVGDLIASGPARVVSDPRDLADFRRGEVLVADVTSPDWEPVMKEAAAIVTNRGGRTCHAAIVAREVGIPAVVGTGTVTHVVRTGQLVTVSCAAGEVGTVYDGSLGWHVERTELESLPRPRTRVMVNLGNPDLAFKTAMLPSDGVGLARMEFIINEAIKAHPMALAHPERVTDPDVRSAIEGLCAGYPDGATYFVERLSEEIGTIAAAFHPRPVIVRMSDFKTNEYASLLGGADFEPSEDNPMIGFRGASRYTRPAYADGFALECRAMVRVRGEMGLDNVILMLPFVRRVQEAEEVLARMAALGLVRGRNGLKVFAMCEVPNNVVLIDDFARCFDGFSIGSNDLTQLTLGVDRDSALVAFDYDERDPGVMQMIRLAVEGCQRNGVYSGLCGQAPSDYPDVAEFLVSLGISSISLDPDAVVRTTKRILAAESRLDGGRHVVETSGGRAR